MQYHLAVDIGASSGRHMLGHVENGKIILEEIYRFENGATEKNGRLCWDLEQLFAHIQQGMLCCAEAGKAPVTMGIDTWGVDFVLLDPAGHVLGDTVAYRDMRTQGMDAFVEKHVSSEALYAVTGIQKQPFNTIYQLMALKNAQPELFSQAAIFLMIPEYFNYLLTGIAKNEYTNATTTGLVNAAQKQWDMPLIETLGYPRTLFCKPLCMPGETVGPLLPAVAEKTGCACTVLLPPTHDTGSAYMAVPACDENAVYLSSGTWSLLGVENTLPITSAESCAVNFTNEGGYGGRYRYLKNIMGLWMIQSIRRNYDKKYSFAQLEEAARGAAQFAAQVDVDDNVFLAPENMVEAVRAQCRATGQPVPESVGEVMQCVYNSLAACYARAVRQLSVLTGKQYTRIHIVGGGSKDGYLNELTACATGLPVLAGPTEGTALGNLLAQMIAVGTFPDLTQARAAVADSFPLKEFLP